MAQMPTRGPGGRFLPRAQPEAGGPARLQALTERDLLERIVLLLEHIAYQTSVSSVGRAQYLEHLYDRTGD